MRRLMPRGRGVAQTPRELDDGVAKDLAQHTVPPDRTRYSRSRLRMVRTETPRALAVWVRLPFRRLRVERISSFSCSITVRPGADSARGAATKLVSGRT